MYTVTTSVASVHYNNTVNYNNSSFTKFKYFVSMAYALALFHCREGLHTILKLEEATSTMVVWS